MAITLTEVQNTPYSKRFLLTNAATLGTSFTITNAQLTTGATGPFKEVVDAGATGIGTVAAGTMTQAQARDLLLSDNTSSIGNENVPRATCELTPRSGNVLWSVDANVSSGLPILELTTTAAASEVYLTVRVQHSYDR